MKTDYTVIMMRANRALKNAWARYEKAYNKDSTQLELWMTWSPAPRSGARWTEQEIEFMKSQVKCQVISNIGPYPITTEFMCKLACIMGRTPTGINAWIVSQYNTDRKFAQLYFDKAGFLKCLS